MKQKIFRKHSFKWALTLALALMFTFAIGKDMKVLADTSTNVSFDQTYSGTAESGERNKYYVTFSEAGRMTFNININEGNVNFWLYDSTYNEISAFSIGDGSNRYVFDLEAGTYEIDIMKKSYTTPTYRLSVEFDSANETYSYSNDMYIDVESQAAIPFGKKITGWLALNDAYDYYKLVMPAAGTVNFSVINAFEMNFDIRDSKDAVLASKYWISGANTYTYTLDKGTYYLRFAKYHNNTGNYYFTATYELDGAASVTAKSTSATALKVTAKKNGTITGYNIRYRKGSGSWKTVTVKGNKNLSKSITGLVPGTYKVQVRTYCTASGKTYYSDWSTAQSVSCKLSKPTSVKVTNSSSKALKITAKKSGTITGFSIRYKKGSGSWKTVTVKGNKNLNKTIKKLTKGSTYKVQVCTYITVSGKNYYSGWSTAKSVTIKK